MTTTPSSQTFNVLLVEDEPRLRDMLETAVGDMDFNIASAASAEAALRVVEQHPPDIAILDLNLPKMSGLELFEVLHGRWPQMQVIVLTGFGDLPAARKAIRLDVVDFLTKPCPLQELEIALSRASERLLQAGHRQRTLKQIVETPPPLQAPPSNHGANGEPTLTLDEMERQHIMTVLRRNNGNRAAAAEELGISVRKLYYRLVQYQQQGRPVA